MENLKNITPEIISAHAECPRKAFLMFRGQSGDEISLEAKLEKRALKNLKSYSNNLKNLNLPIEFKEVTFHFKDLYASVYLLERKDNSLVPAISIGSMAPSDADKMKLSFAGHLMKLSGFPAPTKGVIITQTGEKSIQLEKFYPKIMKNLINLREIIVSKNSPKASLRQICKGCRFWSACYSEAQKMGDLSLLTRLGMKRIEKLNRKGIFSIEQLAITYRPRLKIRAKSKKVAIRTYQPALHALALTEKKILREEMPELNRSKCELFLDLEGLPELSFYYLAGVLVKTLGGSKEYTFWANDFPEERELFFSLIEFLRRYPSVLIYHYGKYDANALEKLSRRYKTDSSNVIDRLINVNEFVYGKIYFPVYSNSLKDLGHYLGVSWPSHSNISSVLPIALRYLWEDTGYSGYKDRLVNYNLSDCRALNKLIDEIERIQSKAEIDNSVGFVSQKEQQSTKEGKKIHAEFKKLLVSGHADFEKRKIG